MLGKYFKKTVFRKEHTADGVVPEAPQGILKKCNACKGAIFTEDVKRNLYICPKCGNSFRATKNINVMCLDCNRKFVICEG